MKVDFELPENLTSWRVQSWAFGRGRSFGEARLELPVSKELQLRPLLPRMAVVGDELVIGAMIQNLSEGAGSFMLTLELEGAEVADQGARKIELEAGAEGVAQWRVTMTKSGAAVFRVKAASADGKLTDGFEQSVPVAAREVSRTVSDTAMIGTNEMIEVILRIDSDESREFLHLRDPIPAGLEPMMQLSGYHQSAYRESWTGESHFFISELSHWNRNHRYTLSVVTEGVCLALPAHVECLYSPEIRGRSAARRFSIER